MFLIFLAKKEILKNKSKIISTFKHLVTISQVKTSQFICHISKVYVCTKRKHIL